MDNALKILEKIWLGVAIVSLVLSGYTYFFGNVYDAKYFLLITVVAFIMHVLRKRQRISREMKNKK